VALAFGGFFSVSALGSGGASATAPSAQAQKSPFGATARTAHASSTGAGVRSLPHSSLRGPASVAHGGSGTSHATFGSAPTGTSRARGGQPRSGAPAQSAASAPAATTTPAATTPAASTTPAAGTTTAPTGTTVAVTTPVVTVTVPLP